MTDRMEPTMQLRWVRRKYEVADDVHFPDGEAPEYEVLQQLWHETTTWWDDDMKQRHSDVVAKEWRDVPVVEG